MLPRKVSLITIVILGTTLPIILLSQLRPYYYSAFNRYSVHQSFENPDPKLLNTKFNQIFEYISPPFTSQLDSSFFSTEDVLHMQDVQNIFKVIYLLLAISVILIVLGYRSFKVINFNISWRKVLLGLAAITALITLLWDPLFILFHRVFFPFNDYWQLNPTTSNLIKFLPGQIFQELAFLLVALWLLELLAVKIIIASRQS